MQKILFVLFVSSLALFLIAKGEAQVIFLADFEENSRAATGAHLMSAPVPPRLKEVAKDKGVYSGNIR